METRTKYSQIFSEGLSITSASPGLHFDVHLAVLVDHTFDNLCSTGTTVCAVNLFKNLPVRKQFYSTVKKKKESLKQLEELVVSFAVICPSVRYVLKHVKETLWQVQIIHKILFKYELFLLSSDLSCGVG